MSDNRPIARTWTAAELSALVADRRPATDDDVSVTLDGERLDTFEKAYRFFTNMNIERAEMITAVDIMFDMADRSGTRHDYEFYEPRSARQDLAGTVVLIAALPDVIASKEHANRPKDHDALPELRTLVREASGDSSASDGA
jgi:hypothetical protein